MHASVGVGRVMPHVQCTIARTYSMPAHELVNIARASKLSYFRAKYDTLQDVLKSPAILGMYPR